MVVLWAANLRTSYESPDLLIGLNFLFPVPLSVLIVYLIGRSFLTTGAPGLLMPGCGVIIWGAAGFVGATAGLLGDSGRNFANITVTIHNTSVRLSAACHLVDVTLSLRQRRALRAVWLWLTAACAAALVVEGLVTFSAIADWMPTLFVQGQGGTLLRQFVPGSAIGMFAITAVLIGSANRRSPSDFTYWYSLALALIAVGLFGVMMEPSHGSHLSWAGRAAQFFGGAYMLVAAIASVRESHAWEIPLEKVLHRQPDFVSEVLKTVGALVTVLDRRGRIVTFNRACEKTTGYALAEVKGKCVWDFLLVPDEVEAVKAVFAQLQAGQFPNTHENYWLAKDGTRRLIHWHNSCLTDSFGAVEYMVATGIDVTERRRVEEALQASEVRFRALVQNSSDNIVLFDGEGTVLYQSPSIEWLLGYRPEERTGRNVFRNPIVHPDDQAAKRAFFETARRRHRTPVTAEFRLRHADGSWRDIEAVGQSFLHDPGVAGIVANYRDVTDRKKAEEAQRQQVQLLHLSYDAILVWRKDGGIEHWNRGAEQLYGFTESEVLGRVTHKLLKTIHPVPWLEIEAAMRKHGQWEGELRHFAKDGHEVTVSARHQLVLGADGIERILETNRDITDRKRAEQALRESERRFHQLFEEDLTGNFLCTREGRILLCNAAFAGIFGFSSADVAMGTSMLELYPDPGERESILATLGAQGKLAYYETWRKRLDGTPIYVLENLVGHFNDQGELYEIQGYVFDDTDRKRAEEALRKSHEELETRVLERTSELSEAVERLRIENIQRKQLEDTLRQSEQQVRFFASQCLVAQETERKRVAGELHDSIAASLSAMRLRIDNIADEIKQGHNGLEPLQDLGAKAMEINNEVRRIMVDLRPSILDDLGIIAAMNWFCREYQKTYSHISIENQIEVPEPEMPDSLKTPIFRISQEAMNNIAKYSQASHVNLSLRRENNSILLTIQDNGQGFDLNTVRRGMGLSTMRERAQLSGGSFELQSAIGKGTIIRVSWPLAVDSKYNYPKRDT